LPAVAAERFGRHALRRLDAPRMTSWLVKIADVCHGIGAGRNFSRKVKDKRFSCGAP
jgi:hypothetical protein